jgi:hypothetical protein
MITPQHLIAAISQEIRILKHLGAKVTAENKDFRFTPEQRSTEELERYIVGSLPAQIKLMIAGGRDENIYNEYEKQFEGMSYTKFVDELDNALTTITADIQSVTDAQRQEQIAIRGMQGPRTKFLNDYVLVFLGAYKMQLFLQLKASGLSELTTYNLWAGIDQPK